PIARATTALSRAGRGGENRTGARFTAEGIGPTSTSAPRREWNGKRLQLEGLRKLWSGAGLDARRSLPNPFKNPLAIRIDIGSIIINSRCFPLQGGDHAQACSDRFTAGGRRWLPDVSGGTGRRSDPGSETQWAQARQGQVYSGG